MKAQLDLAITSRGICHPNGDHDTTTIPLGLIDRLNV